MDRAKTFWYSLKITIEPLMFVLAAASTVTGVLTPHLDKLKMERVYPPPGNFTQKELDKFYSKKMVEWDNNYDYVNLPISCIAGVIYGGFSDYYGRKIPFLIGIFSMIVETAMRMLIWSPDTNLPLYWLYPTAVVAGILGDFLFTQGCINAYVTDEFDDKKLLSIRLIIVQIMYSLGSFSAAQLTKVAENHISRYSILGFVQGMYLFSAVVGVFFISNIKPKRDEKEDRKGILQIAMISFVSLYEAAKIFLVNRVGHRRLLLAFCFYANFLNQFIFGEDKGLIGTYTLLYPFEWSPSEYANYKSARPIIQVVGMIVGILLLKKLFHLKDTTMMLMGIFSLGSSVLIIGLAQKSWEIFASLVPGCFHGLINPMAYSFMASLVHPNEIGKAYALNAIAQKLSSLADSAILQNIYIATVDWCQGFVWYVLTFLSAVSFSTYLTVHIVGKKENIGI